MLVVPPCSVWIGRLPGGVSRFPIPPTVMPVPTGPAFVGVRWTPCGVVERAVRPKLGGPTGKPRRWSPKTTGPARSPAPNESERVMDCMDLFLSAALAPLFQSLRPEPRVHQQNAILLTFGREQAAFLSAPSDFHCSPSVSLSNKITTNRIACGPGRPASRRRSLTWFDRVIPLRLYDESGRFASMGSTRSREHTPPCSSRRRYPHHSRERSPSCRAGLP